MFPEEGKYHHDGHRKCNVCLEPGQTAAMGGICPECKKPLTLGVLYRVHELAERPPGYNPGNRRPFESIIPLAGILSEIFDVGPKSKKVGTHYDLALKRLGPELDILLTMPVSEIEAAGIPLLKEAVIRMREGQVSISPGFDGEYGRVKIFEPEEKQRLRGEVEMFGPDPGSSLKSALKTVKKKKPAPGKRSGSFKKVETLENPEAHKKPLLLEVKEQLKGVSLTGADHEPMAGPVRDGTMDIVYSLNREQRLALRGLGHPLLIEAGPGTGKTRTLTARIAWLIREQGVDPGTILALTFTNRAAGEMQERLNTLLPGREGTVWAGTFHRFCLMVLREYTGFKGFIVDDGERREMLGQAVVHAGIDASLRPGLFALADRTISMAKQHCLGPEDDLRAVLPADLGKENLSLVAMVWQTYQRRLATLDLVDFDDLISMVVTLFNTDAALAKTIRNRFTHILVDEYQDVNKGQYLLVKLMADKKTGSTSGPMEDNMTAAGRGLVVIGDPDQSIYGFRGSDNRYFHQFQTDYPGAEKIVLKRNYRSTEAILKASFQLITHGNNENGALKNKVFSDIRGKKRLVILEAASDRAEAVVVGKRIETLIGGLSLFSMDADKVDSTQEREFSFADFAVLYRTRRQGKIFADQFQRAGIPFQMADKESLLIHPGIGELISLLKLLKGGATLQELFVVLDLLKAGAGKGTRAKLDQWCRDFDLSPAGAVESLKLKNIGGVRKNIAENLSRAAETITELGEIIQGLSACEALDLLTRSTDIYTLIQSDENSCRIYDRLFGDAKKNNNDIFCLLDGLSLDNDGDSLWPGAEKVTLMTMHAAKGLEFPVVFVTGCEPGLIPFALPGGESDNIAEERRLFYVAMTRARDILCLTYARKRRIFGTIKETGPSVFLQDIEAALKEHNQNRFQGSSKKPCDKQLDLFQ
jgi:superfamily I DNA/RNA helicase